MRGRPPVKPSRACCTKPAAHADRRYAWIPQTPPLDPRAPPSARPPPSPCPVGMSTRVLPTSHLDGCSCAPCPSWLAGVGATVLPDASATAAPTPAPGLLDGLHPETVEALRNLAARPRSPAHLTELEGRDQVDTTSQAVPTGGAAASLPPPPSHPPSRQAAASSTLLPMSLPPDLSPHRSRALVAVRRSPPYALGC